METTEATPARPPVVSQSEWDAARMDLPERDRTLRRDPSFSPHKRMPMVRVERDYA